MNTTLREAYKQRVNAAVSLCNYLSTAEYTLDKDNLRFGEDRIVDAMVLFMNNINCFINDVLTNNVPIMITHENGRLKKAILNTITSVAGAAMACGKGLTVEKYSHILKKLIEDIDPDSVIE